MTEEIRDTEWDKFCSSFSSMFAGSLVTIETVDPENVHREIAREVPFEGIEMDHSDRCCDHLHVRAAQDGMRHVDQDVLDPIHIIARRKEDGEKVLEIIGEQGETYIHFHSGVWPERFTAPRQRYAAPGAGMPQASA
jgi:hypothetical protein